MEFRESDHWSMNCAPFKDPVSLMCLAGAVVAGSSPFTVMTNIFVNLEKTSWWCGTHYFVSDFLVSLSATTSTVIIAIKSFTSHSCVQYVLSTTSNEQYMLKESAAVLWLFMIFLGNVNGYVLPFSEQSKRLLLRSVSFCLQIYSGLHSRYLDVQLKILK